MLCRIRGDVQRKRARAERIFVSRYKSKKKHYTNRLIVDYRNCNTSLKQQKINVELFGYVRGQ